MNCLVFLDFVWLLLVFVPKDLFVELVVGLAPRLRLDFVRSRRHWLAAIYHPRPWWREESNEKNDADAIGCCCIISFRIYGEDDARAAKRNTRSEKGYRDRRHLF